MKAFGLKKIHLVFFYCNFYKILDLYPFFFGGGTKFIYDEEKKAKIKFLGSHFFNWIHVIMWIALFCNSLLKKILCEESLYIYF